MNDTVKPLRFTLVWLLAFSGAPASPGFIYLLGTGTPGGLTPMKLTLAGTVVAALLHSLILGRSISIIALGEE